MTSERRGATVGARAERRRRDDHRHEEEEGEGVLAGRRSDREGRRAGARHRRGGSTAGRPCRGGGSPGSACRGTRLSSAETSDEREAGQRPAAGSRRPKPTTEDRHGLAAHAPASAGAPASRGAGSAPAKSTATGARGIDERSRSGQKRAGDPITSRHRKTQPASHDPMIASPPTAPAIAVAGLTKTYKGVTAVDGISFAIRAGQRSRAPRRQRRRQDDDDRHDPRAGEADRRRRSRCSATTWRPTGMRCCTG